MNLEEPRHPGLTALLAAAAAPARPDELAAEAAAVARFRGAYRRPRRRRRLVAVVAAAVAAVSVGGTAFAAGSGHLPGPVRSWFDAGAPPRPAATSARPGDRPRTSPPDATAGPAASGGPAAVPSAAACRVWLAFRADPHARPLTGDERKELARLAGGPGEPQLDDYCTRLLGASVPASAPAPTTSVPASPPRGKPSKSARNASGARAAS